MKKIEKRALNKLKAKTKAFNAKKEELFESLLKNKEFKNLHKQQCELIIKLSKEEFEGKKTKTKQNLEKITNQKNKLGQTFSKNYNLLFKDYLCPNCKDTGFIHSKPCKCLNEQISKLLIDESGITQNLPDFAESNFDLFEDGQKMQTIYQKFEKWTTDYKNSKIKNWGLFGNTGTGKTHLMQSVAKKLIDGGSYIYFTTAFNMTKEMLNQHTDFSDKNRDYISKYIDCDVLFIDDLGTEPVYNNVNQNYLYLITNQRMTENKPTIFSSNFNLEEFEDRYGERIFSRLVNKRNSVSIWFDGNDVRLKK